MLPVATRCEVYLAMAEMKKANDQQEEELTHGDCRDRQVSV